MSEAFWIKLYTDTFENPKIGKIRRLPAGNDILLIWIMLLTTAGKCNAGGLVCITDKIPFTAEDLADKFKFKESTIKLALRSFVEYDMIEIFDGEFIYIKNWSEYQSEDKLAELRAKDRERKRIKRAEAKALALGAAVVPCSVLGSVRGQSSDVSAECPPYRIEEEKKEEINKEERRQETFPHSFVHSANPESQTATENYEQGESTYVEKKVAEAGFEGKDAAVYREELKEGLKMRYLSGSLGQDLVFMSTEQFDDLCNRLSLDEIEKYFAIVADCERTGKCYKKKSHYQAILDMAYKDRRIKQ